MNLKEKLDAMEPEKRQKVVKGGIVMVGLVLALGLYYGSGQSEKKAPEPEVAPSVVQLGEGRLQDDIRAQVSRQHEEMVNQTKRQDAAIAELGRKAADAEARAAALENVLGNLKSGGAMGLPDGETAPSAPGNPADWETGITIPDQTRVGKPGGKPGARAAVGPNGESIAPPPPEFIGGIKKTQAVEGGAKGGAAKAGGASGQNRPKWYLPVGFMPAKVLTGLKAKTVSSARSDPEPMLLRVQAPAVLPNEIRAQLEGCLIVAHGHGSLASERVEAALVSISCMDHDGNLMIEQEITGILVDADGTKGLAGIPVSKMGANLARLAFGSAVEGAGAAFNMQAQTTTVSPLGATSVIEPGQIGRAGAGAGVEAAANEYSRIIADLVRQQAPVIEMGAGKDVTVVITEGVWLEVRDVKQ